MGNSQHGFSEWLVPGLEIVAFRLSRANDCAAEIGSLISNWSYNGPLKFEQRVAGGKYKTVVADIRPIPPKVSLLFSEAVHHIRASLDNVVWFLIESQMVEIPPKLSKKIAMPIYESEEKFDQWARPLIKMGLSMLSAEAELGRSIRDLQPYVDRSSEVPSTGEFLAALIGEVVDHAHPLLLLREYSNEDKHRAPRPFASRTFMANDDHASIAQVASSKELKIGDTVSQGTWGELKEIETNTAVVIDRPLGARAFVNPALEINALRRYVAEIAVPTLLAGLALPEGIPSSVDLEDSGKSYPLRLSEGKTEDAISKGAEERMKLYVAAMNRQPEVPKVVFEDG